jgi:hypothetical protein
MMKLLTIITGCGVVAPFTAVATGALVAQATVTPGAAPHLALLPFVIAAGATAVYVRAAFHSWAAALLIPPAVVGVCLVAVGAAILHLSAPALPPVVLAVLHHITVILVGAPLLALALKALVTWWSLRNRRRRVVWPSPDFDPHPSEVESVARQLARTRRSLIAGRAASAYVIRLEVYDDDAYLGYEVDAPPHAAAQLRGAFASYSEVTTREQRASSERTRGGHVTRYEMVLRRRHREDAPPALILRPDQLQAFARAVGDVRVGDGEEAGVRVGLLPTSWEIPAQVNAQGEEKARGPKETTHEAGFRGQVLIRTRAATKARADDLARELLGAWARFPDWRPAFHLTPWWRLWFDLRWHTGLFWTAHRRHTHARELAGLLKPATVGCSAENIERVDVMGRAPSRLPVYQGQHGVLPLGRLGRVEDPSLPVVGAPASHVHHVAVFGRAGYSKSSWATDQGLHEALVEGHCLIVVDPADDLVEDLKAYLTAPEVACRVDEIDLAGQETRPQPASNVVARQEGEPKHVRVRVLREALAVALGWQGSFRRLLAVATLCARTLVELAELLPPELCPTLFEFLPLLTDEEWRTAVVSRLSWRLQRAWSVKLPAEAVGSIAAAIGELRESPAATALFGASVSTFNARRAMDEGRIVLVRPGHSTGHLAAALLFQSFVAAGFSRADTPIAQRRPVRMLCDELPAYAAGLGPLLGVILAELRKFRVYLTAIAQSPDQLPGRLLLEVLTNCSATVTFRLNSLAASLEAREWGGKPTAAQISRLPKYVAYCDIELGLATGRPTPFMLRTVRPQELFARFHRPAERARLEAALDSTGRRQVEDVEREVDARPELILDFLGLSRGEAPTSPSLPPAGPESLAPAPARGGLFGRLEGAWERARRELPELPERPQDLERDARRWAVRVLRDRQWSLRQLSDAFGVSVATIRRDLGLLNSDGQAGDQETAAGG